MRKQNMMEEKEVKLVVVLVFLVAVVVDVCH